MNIALLTDGIPPYVMGGMQKHSRLLADYAAQSGIKVLLYHSIAEHENVKDEEVLSTFSASAQPNITIRTFTYGDNGWFPGHYLRAQKELSERYMNALLEESTQPDFVYTKGFTGWKLLEKRAVDGYHCPIGVKFHGMNMFQAQPDFKSELTKYLLRSPVKWIMNHADYVFSYGGEITNIIRRAGIDRSKIIDIPSGIERASVRNQQNDRDEALIHFAFVGRYDRLKGLPELYQALEKIEHKNWKLTIIGPVPSEHQQKDDRITYVGKLNAQSEVFQILDHCDVLLCPSISEGMPNVILEAMARGLAIVATDVGATALLVQDNGRLIPPGNVEALCKALEEFITLPSTSLQKMKLTSRQRVEKEFTWEAVIEKFIGFLNGIPAK